MLCCTCEVNDNYAAAHHAALPCHFSMFRQNHSSDVNHVFHTLYV